jgi:hypothetical protein
VLRIGSNRLFGQLPNAVDGLVRLRELNASVNDISGSIPAMFSALSALEYALLPLPSQDFCSPIIFCVSRSMLAEFWT